MATATTIWDERLEELHGLAPGEFGGTFEDWIASLYPEDRADCLARVERGPREPRPVRTPAPDDLGRRFRTSHRMSGDGSRRRNGRADRNDRCRHRRDGSRATRGGCHRGARAPTRSCRHAPTGAAARGAPAGTRHEACCSLRRGRNERGSRRRLVRRPRASRRSPRACDRRRRRSRSRAPSRIWRPCASASEPWR